MADYRIHQGEQPVFNPVHAPQEALLGDRQTRPISPMNVDDNNIKVKSSVITSAMPMLSASANSSQHKYEPANPAYAHGTVEQQYVPRHRISSDRRSSIFRKFGYWIHYFITVLVVAVPLIIPVALFQDDQDISDDTPATKRLTSRNLAYWMCFWLLITWLLTIAVNLVSHGFPHLFKIVAGFVNPAHQRYWKIFRAMMFPLTYFAAVVIGYIVFGIYIYDSDYILANRGRDPAAYTWDAALSDVMQVATLWGGTYLGIKIMVLYISLHYHYRTDQRRISKTKDMHAALVTLYEASLYLYPDGHRNFTVEDHIIRNTTASGDRGPVKYLHRIGAEADKAFGKFSNDNPNSHWFKPNAPYAVVERALTQPKSAAALAKRIWTSLVIRGAGGLTAEDIAEVLGPYRREEAQTCFKALDENESGDIRLNEMVWTVIEVGRVRKAIFQGLIDIDHCINTFEWICITLIAAVMIVFIMIIYIPAVKEIQATLNFAALGVSFALGRTFNKFLSGCVYVFFEHPYDVGDRIEIYNLASTVPTSVIVTRVSIFYTVFRRVDNGKDLQVTNERLALSRVENVTRSGLNKESHSIFVDFRTSFKDILFLKKELETFLSQKENSRDYKPEVGLSLVNLHELQKMELKVGFTHKSNWSNDSLRASRSSKFMCALVAAIRKVPLNKPGSAAPALGESGKPNYTVMITDEDAAKKADADKVKREQARIDYIKPVPTAEAPQIPEINTEAQTPEEKNINEAEGKKLAVEAEEKARKAAKEAADKEAEQEALTGLTIIQSTELTGDRRGDATGTGAETEEVFSFVRHVSTGLRTRSGSGPESNYY